MTEIDKLREQRAKLVEDQRVMLDLAEAEKRDLTAEETGQYEAMDADYIKLSDEITETEKAETAKRERAEKLEEREAELKEHRTVAIKPDVKEERKEDKKETGIEPKYSTPEYASAFDGYLRSGVVPVEYEAELRALQADSDTVGGFMVVPEQFVNRLIQDKDRMVFVRQFATIIPVPKAVSLGVPVLDTDMGPPTFTSELKVGGEDTSMDFEKRELYPHPAARYIKVSNKLVNVSTINMESLIRQRLAYQSSIVEENAFLNATGTNEPLGVFVASDAGIGTSRDCADANTSGAIKADNLINCKYKLEAQYRTGCRWMFHRDAIKQIRKLKYGDGTYMWKAGISSDRPDTILDFPVHESEYVPNTFSASEYIGILGNFEFYWIADCMAMQVTVLKELFAMTNQIAFVLRFEVDGMPVHEKAFVRVKLGT